MLDKILKTFKKLINIPKYSTNVTQDVEVTKALEERECTKGPWGLIIPHSRTKQGWGIYVKQRVLSEYSYCQEMLMHMAVPYRTLDHGDVSKAVDELKKFDCTSVLILRKTRKLFSSPFRVYVLEGAGRGLRTAMYILDAFNEAFPARRVKAYNAIRIVDPINYPTVWEQLTMAKKQGMFITLMVEEFSLGKESYIINPKDLANFWEKTLKKLTNEEDLG